MFPTFFRIFLSFPYLRMTRIEANLRVIYSMHIADFYRNIGYAELLFIVCNILSCLLALFVHFSMLQHIFFKLSAQEHSFRAF